MRLRHETNNILYVHRTEHIILQPFGLMLNCCKLQQTKKKKIVLKCFVILLCSYLGDEPNTKLFKQNLTLLVMQEWMRQCSVKRTDDRRFDNIKTDAEIATLYNQRCGLRHLIVFFICITNYATKEIFTVLDTLKQFSVLFLLPILAIYTGMVYQFTF